MKKYIYIPLLVIFLYSCKKERIRIDTDETLSLLTEINKLRAAGCMCGTDTMPPVHNLIANNFLAAAAIKYAQEMNTKNFFSHVSPDGTSPAQRAIKSGYNGAYVGEILARNYNSIIDVMAGWKLSTEHCKAMMDSQYNEMGAGRSDGYWVVNFGHP